MAGVELSYLLKNPKDCQRAIDASLRIAGHGREVAIQPGGFRAPHRTTLKRWQIRMDTLLMMFRRWEWSQGLYNNAYFFLGYDSSPQGGYDYFLVREKILYMPDFNKYQADPLSLVAAEHRLKPITVLGWGEGGTTQKIKRLTHGIILESGDK